MKVTVEVRNDCKNEWTPDAAHCTDWIQSALALTGHTHDCSVSLSFVGERASATLNKQYRGQDKATNVLSFPSEFPENLTQLIAYQPLGDIVICPAIIAKEAAQQDKPLPSHWAHMLIHGVLHLLGYDHVEKTDARKMEQLEIQALATLGVPDPYLIG